MRHERSQCSPCGGNTDGPRQIKPRAQDVCAARAAYHYLQCRVQCCQQRRVRCVQMTSQAQGHSWLIDGRYQVNAGRQYRHYYMMNWRFRIVDRPRMSEINCTAKGADAVQSTESCTKCMLFLT